MKLDKIYILGQNFEYLRRVCTNIKNKKMKCRVKEDDYILDALKDISNFLAKYSISKKTQIKIKEITEVFDNFYSIDQNSSNYYLTLKHADFLLNDLLVWDDRITEELSNIIMIRAFSNGSLNHQKLCNGAEEFFAPKIWKKIKEIAKEDLEEAIKCLLTQSWTASGIMSMRALESGVKSYYAKITDNSAEGKTLGTMIHELKQPNSNTDSKLIGYLDYLKDIRNNLAHPNNRICQFEAEQAFQHTIQILSIVYR